MLQDFIPNKSYAIVAGYCNGEIVAALGGVIYHDALLEIFFPKVNPFSAGQEITLHLDNRTGLEEFDASLKVYRVSVKARVLKHAGDRLFAELVEYDLRFSNRSVDKYVERGYEFPADTRKMISLQESTITEEVVFNDREEENKVGVLVTKAVNRPHTTVMAFLSSMQDDIFIITQAGSFKAHNIHRDDNCVFAIDHRSTYNFEKAIDWNYTLIKGKIRAISKSNPMFAFIQSKFIEKNPWEYVFFTDKSVEMFHIEALEIMCPERLANTLF